MSITFEEWEDPCKSCSRVPEAGQEKNLRFFATSTPGSPSDAAGPFCPGCLVSGKARIEFDFEDLAVESTITKGRRPPSYSTNKKSKQMEEAFAEAIGATRVSGSGAGITKGDIRLPGRWRGELKNQLKTDSFRITRDLLEKIEAECAYPEKPVFGVEFLHKMSRAVVATWVLITRKDWEELVALEGNAKPARRR